jgi:hypothetical protein
MRAVLVSLLLLGGTAHADDPAPPPPAVTQPNLWPGASLLAIGTASLGVGTYLVITGGPAGPGEAEPRTLTRVPGFVIGGIGVAALGVGTYLLVRELEKQREPALTITGGVVPGRVFLGASGRF